MGSLRIHRVRAVLHSFLRHWSRYALSLTSRSPLTNKFHAGSIPWFFASEIFPSNARGKANSVAILSNWLANLVVSTGFLPMNVSHSGRDTHSHILEPLLERTREVFVPRVRRISRLLRRIHLEIRPGDKGQNSRGNPPRHGTNLVMLQESDCIRQFLLCCHKYHIIVES